MAEIDLERIKAGQALYTKRALLLYDPLALRLNCRLIWGCPLGKFRELYNEHVSANHLDIGVGTGFFLDSCRFPAPPRLALMDVNPNCLEVAAKRLRRYKPEIYQRNILDRVEIDAPHFDSVAIVNLLHCLPGNMRTKSIVFENARRLLNPGGVLFGTTFLYRGMKRGVLATVTFEMANRLRFMTNKEDDLEGLRNNLRSYFIQSDVRLNGCEAFFWARR